MTVTVPNPTIAPPRRSAAPPRPAAAARRSGPPREVPLPEVLDITLATGLRVLAARKPAGADGRAAAADPVRPGRRAGGRIDAPSRATSPPPRCSPTTLLTGTATRDRVGDRRRARRRRRRAGCLRRSRAAPDRRVTRWPPGCRRSSTCSPTCSPAPRTRTTRWRASASRLVERITVARAQPRMIAREALQRKRVRRPPDHAGDADGPRTSPPSSPRTSCARCTPRASCRAARCSCSSATSTRTTRSRSSSSALGGWTAATPRRGCPRRRRWRRRPAAGPPAGRRCSRSCGCPRRRCRRTDPRYPRCSWRTSSSAATSPRGWWRTSARTRATPTARTRALEFVPGTARCWRSRPTSASEVTAAALLETRYELGRIVAGAADGRTRSTPARRYAVGSLLISTATARPATPPRSRSLAADGVSVQLAARAPGAAGGGDGGGGGRGGGEFFAPTRVHRRRRRRRGRRSGPALRALGGVDLP